MSRLNIKDPASIFPDDPALQRMAKLVLRDDVAPLAEALQREPGLVNRVGAEGVGLLLVAVANSKPRAVRTLLKAGANPFQPASEVSNLATPATLALRMRSSPDIFTIMIEEGIDLDRVADEDDEALIVTAIMEADDSRLRQLLASRRVNVNLATTIQVTPLHYAIASRQYAKALLLLDAGADPGLGDTNPLEELVKRHDNWAPGTPSDTARRELIRRLRAAGLTEKTPMRPARVWGR